MLVLKGLVVGRFKSGMWSTKKETGGNPQVKEKPTRKEKWSRTGWVTPMLRGLGPENRRHLRRSRGGGGQTAGGCKARGDGSRFLHASFSLLISSLSSFLGLS